MFLIIDKYFRFYKSSELTTKMRQFCEQNKIMILDTKNMRKLNSLYTDEHRENWEEIELWEHPFEKLDLSKFKLPLNKYYQLTFEDDGKAIGYYAYTQEPVFCFFTDNITKSVSAKDIVLKDIKIVEMTFREM